MYSEIDLNTPTLSDSGTNIDVVDRATAEALEERGFEYMVIKQNQRRHKIQFGKSSAVEQIIGYIVGSGIVKRLAVVENIGANLISVHNLTKQGIVVQYDEKGVKLLYEDVVILMGSVGEDGLYHMNLIEMLLTCVGTGAAISDASANEEVHRSYTTRMNARHAAKYIKMAMTLHKNLKHIPYTTMARNIECGAWEGINKNITPSLLRMLGRRKNCITCAVNRWNQVPYMEGEGKDYMIGEAFSLDYVGKMSTKSKGCDGVVVISDVDTERMKVYGTKTKTSVLDACDQWMLYMLAHGHRPKWLFVDAGAVENGAVFIAAMARLGVTVVAKPDHISAYQIERAIQLLKNDVAAVIECTATFGAKDWLPAATFAAELRATCANSKTKARHASKSPMELVEGRKPNLARFLSHGLGDIAVARTPKAKRSGRMDVGRNELGRIVGVSTDGTPGADFELLDGGEEPRRRGHLQKVNVSESGSKKKVEVTQRGEWMDIEVSEKPLDTRRKVEEQMDRDTITAMVNEGNGEDKEEDVYMRWRRETGDDEDSDDETDVETTSGDSVVDIETMQELVNRSLESKEIGEAWKETKEDNIFVDKQGKKVRSPMTRRQQSKGIEPSYWVDSEAFAAFFDGVASNTNALHNDQDVFELLSKEYEPANSADPRLIAYWKERLHRLSDYDADDVDNVYYLSTTTGLIVDDEENEDNDDGYVSDGAEMESGTSGETYVAAMIGDWERVSKAYKVRIKHGENNPTNSMLMKDGALHEKWKESNMCEFEGMIRNKLLVRVSESEAMKEGVTPHVTTRITKRKGEKKTRISNDGRYEMRQGLFETREENHSPAMDDELVKFLLIIAAYHNYKLGGADVEQAFTHNHMSEADKPRRIIWYLNEIECGIPGGAHYELQAISYGCADAGKEWYKHVRTYLVESLQFSVSVFHPCLFIQSLSDGSVLLIGLATDNCLIVSPPTEIGDAAVKAFRNGMDAKWPMTHEVEVDDILGLAVSRGEEGSITITQPAMLASIKDTFFPSQRVRTHDEKMDLSQAHNPDLIPLILTPLAPNLIKNDMREEGEESVKITTYQQHLGKLGYMRLTRYDGVPGLSRLAEHTVSPTIKHERGLHWLAAFFLSSADVGVTFHRGPSNANIQEVMEWMAYGDASWAASQFGLSRFGAALISHMPHLGESKYQGAMLGKSVNEKGIPSMSASIAELNGTVMAADLLLPVRGMSEEVAGVANDTTITDKPGHTAPPSKVHLDNRSLGVVLDQTTSNKGRGMRRVARLIQYIKGLCERGLISVQMVPGSKQLADPLTKFFVSPTEQWRTAEYLQGTHPEVTRMQQVAEAMGAAKKRQQMNYKDMEEVDDGVYVYGGDEEAILNTAMNVSVPCNANDDAMSDLTKSSLTSREGWTEGKQAVGNVMVEGDSSIASQVPMEVVGETNVNSKAGMKKQRGNKKSKAVRNRQLAKQDKNR